LVPTLALTATASPQLLVKLEKSLMLASCKIVSVNPNRRNIYLEKNVRLSNHHGSESYRAILEPIAQELVIQREKYPMTIIYLKLKYCGYAYSLFERILNENQYVGDSKEPTGRLFAQFHSPQTDRMKKELITEIKKADSRVRVIFATSALGMGVDSPYVTSIIHISPPSSLEAYMQEIGRAGRTVGIQARATLYYNNSDISKNKLHINQSMKDYCQTTEMCMRKIILEYFGFKLVKQNNCCTICDKDSESTENVLSSTNKKVRELPTENRIHLKSCTQETSQCFSMIDVLVVDINDMVENIMDGIEYISSESDLLNKHGIWDEACSSQYFLLCASLQF
jgi:superfamily II DNA helicase RecQ